MGKNSTWGNNAYKEVRHNGGSKQEAREACSNANKSYSEHTQLMQFGKCTSYNNDVSDVNNDINDGIWHTSEDL